MIRVDVAREMYVERTHKKQHFEKSRPRSGANAGREETTRCLFE
jgi:hypothetical protein